MSKTIKTLIDIDAVRLYLVRIGAEPRSLRTAVVRQDHGKYWKDLAVIRFGKEGEVSASNPSFNPTAEEAEAIKKAWAKTSFPEHTRVNSIVGSNPPAELKQAKKENVFEFRDNENNIIMVQLRTTNKAGDKAYIPWTYWSDGIWRKCEPDGKLPLFNAHLLKDAAVVFIHEGAKAARAVQNLVGGKGAEATKALADHPWGQDLAHAVHLGWIGGALSPERTDWSAIGEAGVKRAYIVGDNDNPGRAAVPQIAKQLRIPTFAVQFTDEFPASFDLADEFPKRMFTDDTLARYYTGPKFRDCVHPATWATDPVVIDAGGKSKVVHVLRDSFKNMWAYVSEVDAFVCKEMPTTIFNETVLNKFVHSFSDVKETSHLITKAYSGQTMRLCYRPDHKGLIVTFHNTSAINLHTPSSVVARAGDIGPWIKFLDYLFPRERERKEVERWCATLIAKPEVRMGYALLLISESQGIGKTTLASQVLAPLVGTANVGWPGEMDIASSFNGWAANKRLIIISEVYAGSSWKAYHTLKSVITDREINVNEKYQRAYLTENWAHLIACSNSMRALKVEQDDRRWFYPEMAEKPWPGTKFAEFRRWLESGGLSIIRHWADNFKDYVKPYDRAPMTDGKIEMIEGSLSEAQREAAAVGDAVVALGKPAALIMSAVKSWVQQQSQGKVHDSDYELRRTMAKREGLKQYPKRLKIGARMEYVMINAHLQDALQRLKGDDGDRGQVVRAHIIDVSSIMSAAM
jgi:hypothetical protein